jgi:hypothetical protein
MQQWICDAVVPAVKPLNVTSTNNVFATSSVITVAKPVPGDAFGGDSPGPVRLAVYVITFAWAAGVGETSATANASISGCGNKLKAISLQEPASSSRPLCIFFVSSVMEPSQTIFSSRRNDNVDSAPNQLLHGLDLIARAAAAEPAGSQ